MKVQTVTAGEYDLSTPSGRLSARIVGDVARHESEHKSERIRRQKIRAREQGRWTGGPIPLGWVKVDSAVVVDKAAAAAIRLATEQVIEGRSLGSVAAEWGRAGLGGRSWDYTTVRQVLGRARNAGLIEHRTAHGTRTIIGPSEWPAFVTENELHAMRAVFSDPARRRLMDTRVRHLLSGIVLCPCGLALVSGLIKSVSVYRCRVKGRGHVCRPAAPHDLYVRLMVAGRLSRDDGASSAEVVSSRRARSGMPT